MLRKSEELFDKLTHHSSSHENKYQDYYTLGKAYLYLGDKINSINNFELELELGINIGYYKFNPKTYLETIENLLSLYTIREKKKLIKLKNIILDIPPSLLITKFTIFIIKRYHDLMLQEEVSELLNKFYKKL